MNNLTTIVLAAGLTLGMVWLGWSTAPQEKPFNVDAAINECYDPLVGDFNFGKSPRCEKLRVFIRDESERAL